MRTLRRGIITFFLIGRACLYFEGAGGPLRSWGGGGWGWSRRRISEIHAICRTGNSRGQKSMHPKQFRLSIRSSLLPALSSLPGNSLLSSHLLSSLLHPSPLGCIVLLPLLPFFLYSLSSSLCSRFFFFRLCFLFSLPQLCHSYV